MSKRSEGEKKMRVTKPRIDRMLRLANASVKKWRQRLRVDGKWEVEVCYKHDYLVDEHEKVDKKAYIVFDDDVAQYWKVTLCMYRPLMEDPDAPSIIDTYVAHEMGHHLMWQFSSFAKNLANRQQPIIDELEKLEEQVVQQLEEIWTQVKWPRKIL